MLIGFSCWYAVTYSSTQRTHSVTALARIIPVELDGSPVYPSNHVVIPQVPQQSYSWKTIVLPQAWATGKYNFEIWDATNHPLPGWRSKKLISNVIALDLIDASLYSAIRLVIFQPIDQPPLLSVTTEPIYFTYAEHPNKRLIILMGIIMALYLGVMILYPRASFHPRFIGQQTMALFKQQPLASGSALILTIVWSGWFGMILGSFIGGVQIFYLFIKLPFLLMGALAISLTTIVIITLISGVKTTGQQLVNIAVQLLAVTALGLAATSPIILFYIVYPLAHDFILIAAMVAFALAGLLAMLRLQQWLRTRGVVVMVAGLVTLIWLIVYGFVFLQLGWLLRPWVGITDPVQGTVPFARPYSGNVFIEIDNAIKRLNNN